MNTDLSYSFEVQLSEQHERLLCAGRWDGVEQAASKAGEFLSAAVANGFTNASVKVVPVEEYSLLDAGAE